MKKSHCLRPLVALMLLSCSTSPVAPHSEKSTQEQRIPEAPAAREAANAKGCENFIRDPGFRKSIVYEGLQRGSMQERWRSAQNDKAPELLDRSVLGFAQSAQNLEYTKMFLGGWYSYTKESVAALLATGRFLAPSVSEGTGARSLQPTFLNDCELVQVDEVKKVHALGTMATGRMNIYPKLKVLGEDDQVTGEVENPWSGLLSPVGHEALKMIRLTSKGPTPSHDDVPSVDVLLRFSIANPVAGTIKVGKKDLQLEFIPGLGIKFFVDGKRSIDLVAMESLAGQGADHNYFKYEFSPDFSGHAPEKYNTAEGQEKKDIIERYNHNAINHHVMTMVGDRFVEVIGQVMKNIDVKTLDFHSNKGPHSFLTSFDGLVETKKSGEKVPSGDVKRPWRLVFKPALDNLSDEDYKKVTDSTPFKIGKYERDFRYKLAHLKPGHRVYYVIGETEHKKRFILGDIVLTSYVSPSTFADKLYFIQHRLDLARMPGAPATIVDPE